MKQLIPQSLKNYYHLMQAILANIWYGFPSGHVKVIGVTGTNGKTTTCQLITSILKEAGYPEREWVNKTKFTTLSAWRVQRFLKEAVDEGCKYVVLETSSHALDQNRVWGVDYDTAVMTNVTREHLDYHKTMEEYRMAKYKLFTKAKKVVVNLDMEMPRDYLIYTAKKKFGYTLKDEHFCTDFDCGSITIVKAEGITLATDRSMFRVGEQMYSIQLPGEFNIENALAAICVGNIYKVPGEKMSRALENIPGVPGRLEFIPNARGIFIIIDYAVTPDSLDKVYRLLTKMKKEGARIISVFGSCGERDRGKRPIMGGIVSSYADYVIVTNEDPYREDPMQIMNEVGSGVKYKQEGEDYWKILDRREAIKKALEIAKPGDLVVVTGKGAEETMAVGEARIPWNDKQVIMEELASMSQKG
jgi:UDP-N-acetylmuramoyl-L-alanyl-D-glutamate--2,6-diaminopimelate ligase